MLRESGRKRHARVRVVTPVGERGVGNERIADGVQVLIQHTLRLRLRPHGEGVEPVAVLIAVALIGPLVVSHAAVRVAKGEARENPLGEPQVVLEVRSTVSGETVPESQKPPSQIPLGHGLGGAAVVDERQHEELARIHRVASKDRRIQQAIAPGVVVARSFIEEVSLDLLVQKGVERPAEREVALQNLVR